MHNIPLHFKPNVRLPVFVKVQWESLVMSVDHSEASLGRRPPCLIAAIAGALYENHGNSASPSHVAEQ